MKNYHHKNSFGAFVMGAVTIIAVGGYLFFGSKRAKRNRVKVDWWIEDMKDEVLSKAENIKDITEEKFEDIVKGVMKKYSRLKHMKEEKMEEIKETLMDEWNEIQEEMEEEDDDE